MVNCLFKLYALRSKDLESHPSLFFILKLLFLLAFAILLFGHTASNQHTGDAHKSGQGQEKAIFEMIISKIIQDRSEHMEKQSLPHSHSLREKKKFVLLGEMKICLSVFFPPSLPPFLLIFLPSFLHSFLLNI